MAEAIALGILDTSTVENIKAFPTVYKNPNWTLWHQLKRFFAHYTRDADAPMLWTDNNIQFWTPPMLHPSVKRLMFMSAQISEQDLRKVHSRMRRSKSRTSIRQRGSPGIRSFQIRTGIYPQETLLNYDTDWDILGMSETGQRFFLGIQAEIERDPSVKHAIITNLPIMEHLKGIAAKENVCLVEDLHNIIRVGSVLETAEVVWIVSTPHWAPGMLWRQAQILFGNEEKSLCYEGETESDNYKDERVRRMYEQNVLAAYSLIL